MLKNEKGILDLFIQLVKMHKIYYLLLILSGFWGNYSYAQQSQQDVDQLLLQAQEAFQFKQYAASEKILQLAINTYPKNILYRIELAQEYRAQNKLSASSVVLQKTLHDQLENKDVFLLLTDNYYRIGAYNKGLKTINKGLAIYYNSGVFYEKKGNLLEAIRKIKKAKEAYELGIHRDTNYVENYLQLSRLEVVADRPEKACILAEIYILKNPTSKKIMDAKKILRAAYRNFYLDCKEHPYKASSDSCLSLFASLFKDNANNLDNGIDALSLCKLRSKMAMQTEKKGVLPYQLNHIWNTLMRGGFFEAYHYWLFTAIEDPNSYAAWMRYHKGAEKELLDKIATLWAD